MVFGHNSSLIFLSIYGCVNGLICISIIHNDDSSTIRYFRIYTQEIVGLLPCGEKIAYHGVKGLSENVLESCHSN